jgi:valyl-tRNA synthetase
MNPDGTMNENAFKYNKMDRFECREKLVEELKEKGYLISIEKIIHSVGHSERTGVMVEPYLSKQWFVKMRPLADAVLENQKNKDKKVNFVPARYEKTMNHWMEITYDWCISRQLWWGHRIPAWYKDDKIYVGTEAPKESGWVQDPDVLDTWFSSALWPFSTLGWPNNTEDLKRYYPNNVLVTGYDIIPFWVNRMTFQGLELMGQRPFKDCLIHGLIRDKQGRKMSKSLGNGVDPMDVIDKYGADSLRFFLTTNTASGMDLRYDEEKVKSTWNFINKLWNASRYVLMNLEDFKEEDITLDDLTLKDKWILTKLNQTIKNVTKSMDKYDFNIVGNTLYSFIWNDFCDKYIELSKFNMNNTTKSILLKVLTDILKMMHPFMPYVTEEIYTKLPVRDSESIMISSYPIYNKNEIYENELNIIEDTLEFITLFRNKKEKLNIGSDYKVIVHIDNIELKELIMNMLKLNDKEIVEENINKESISANGFTIDIYYDNSKNLESEKNNLIKEKDKLILSIDRRKKLLSNNNYVSKAPANIVENERIALAKEEEKLQIILDKLND